MIQLWDVNISCDFKGVTFRCAEESLDDHIRSFIKTELLDGNSFDITVETVIDCDSTVETLTEKEESK